MQNQPSSLPKPITDVWRPELVALPRLTLPRRLFRAFFQSVSALIAHLLMRITLTGLENFPDKGPAIVVFNHLGDWDAILLGAILPKPIEAMGKIELNDHWFVGPVFRGYGFIWVHRGQPDRRAIRAALDGLAEGRMIMLAPEGRQTVTGGLEDGTDGASFLAMKSGAMIVPIGITGTENARIERHIKQWKRAAVSMSVGKPFYLKEQVNRQEMMREGTRQIMESLAVLLPPAYRGKYNV